MPNKVLIVGASGVVGTASVDAFLVAGWDVVAVSRRRPEVRSASGFQHLSLNLFDAAACDQALRGLSGITHIVFSALSEKPGLIDGWSDPKQMEINLAMLKHCIEPLIACRSPLEHVSLMQGTKAYGMHLHPMRIPSREREPRDSHSNFYWLQEDYIRDKADRHGSGTTIFRPPMVVGGAYNAAMNIPTVLGAYAAICHELGEPFGFPGGAPFVWEAADSRLVAKAFVWAAHATQARNQTFNISNGDIFDWRNLWPAIAETLGVDAAADRPMSMAQYLPGQAAVWDRIVARHGLRPIGLTELLGQSHYVTDLCFACGAKESPPPMLMSEIKLRKAGFNDCCDTEDMWRYWLGDFIDRGIFPRH